MTLCVMIPYYFLNTENTEVYAKETKEEKAC